MTIMHDNYPKWVSYYRENDYRIFYQDEICVFKNMACTKIWKVFAAERMETEYKVLAGKKDRSLVFRLGFAESGLLENCLLLFRGSKSNNSSDYHTEMKWFVFSDWCESKVFPAMKRIMQKSVLVLDRARYHTFLDEEGKRPTTSWTKKKLAHAIVRWDGIPDDWLLTWRVQKSKNELLEKAREITDTYT